MEEETQSGIISPEIQNKINQVQRKVADSVANFETRNRVTTTTIVLMLSVAGFYDLLQFGFNFIPFIGWIFASFVGIYSWLTFYVWTSIKGWGFADTLKKWGVQVLYFFGIISILDWGPEITLGVFWSLLIIKSEDYVYNKSKGYLDVENIKEGIQFFNLLRDVTKTGNETEQSSSDTSVRERLPLRSMNYVTEKNPEETEAKNTPRISNLLDLRDAERPKPNLSNTKDGKLPEAEVGNRNLKEILKSNVSEKYKDVIDEVKKSKIDWAHSEELARRLKLKGATEEDVLQARTWLSNNASNAKTFVLPPDKFSEIVSVLHEMTGEENIKEGDAFHVPGGRTDIPEYIKSSVIMKERPARPPLPGQKDKPTGSINIKQLHHEYGHVTEDGLLDSELYKDWKPKFKEGAPDKKYIGGISETDTRIRSMFRDLEGIFNPQKEAFGEKHLKILRERLSNGQLSRDTKDLFDHYDDDTIIEMANSMPAI